MAKKKTEVPKKSKQSSGPAKPVETYEHKASKRLNNPQVGLVNTKTEKEEKRKTYSYDSHLDPTLQWSSKTEKTSFEIPTVSLHVHEKIDPRTIIETVKKSPEKIWEQLNLFNRPVNKLSFLKEIEFYKHQKDWSNRLVAGDSLLVMNSLLEKEGMGGKVQTVYIDPPYGVKYGSNFQPFVNKREVIDGKDESLTQEPEQIQAYRDTWELGIHSYLSYLRDRILLAKDLLAESGSIFVQISDTNLHYVRCLVDEVFGSENFVEMISFQTAPYATSNLLPVVHDYIIWYAKDKKKIKYRQLFRDKGELSSIDLYRYILSPDGKEYRSLTSDEIESGKIPSGWRQYRLVSLVSQGASATPQPFVFNGKTYLPPANSHWKVAVDGLKRVAEKNRIQATTNSVQFRSFMNDFPISTTHNLWTDTITGSFNDPKIYAVQTNLKVIERCILMTTDPGDVIFDPTCGSGTTAVASEKWGRRWITCDTSRVAISLARQRLMTSMFDYYALRNDEEGVDSGFQYEEVDHLTLSSIAYDQTPVKEVLYDRPLVDKKKMRVSGPFTVEAVPAPVVRGVGASENMDEGGGMLDWIRELQKSGIRSKNKNYIRLSMLEPIAGTKWLHAIGSTNEERPQRVVVSFGPSFAPLEQRQVELALLEAEKIKPSPTIIVFAAFQFDPEAAKDIDQIEWGGVSILKVQMNSDLFTDDLKKKRSSNESFWLVGQPDVQIEKLKSGEYKNKYQVTVKGFDYFNPKTGAVESGNESQISIWMLDTDYDGRSLLPKQVFFPMSGDKEGWSRLAKTMKNEIDEDLIDAYRGTVSVPFEAGENKKIAVKIIDDRGIESLLVQELES